MKISTSPERIIIEDADGNIVRLGHRSDGMTSVRARYATFLGKEERQALAAWLLAIDAEPRYQVRQIPGLALWTVWDNESPEGWSNGFEDHKQVFSQRSDADALAAKLNKD